MRNQNVYSAQNVISLVVVFCIIFWLLYSIGSFLHKSQKISHEIEEIKKSNDKIALKIEEKKAELEYLKTPQRIEKEAKMQKSPKRNEKCKSCRDVSNVILFRLSSRTWEGRRGGRR